MNTDGKAGKQDAMMALGELFEWVGNHNWTYDDCPNLYDSISVLDSYINGVTVKESKDAWNF